MKYVVAFLTVFLLAGQVGNAQDSGPKIISLLELISNPPKFNGKVVTIRGFLEISDRDLIYAVLHLHEEDAKYELLPKIRTTV